LNTKAFDNVKNQVGCCGIWCGSCVVGNGTLRELTRRYEHIIGGYGVDDWGAKDFDGKVFMKGLASIQSLPICAGCRKGVGNDECRIRPCVSNRGISDCMECGERKTCNNAEALQRVRTGALRVGMLAKTEDDKTDYKRLAKKWAAELKDKWPCCILFTSDH
jgi:hypothetical protein